MISGANKENHGVNRVVDDWEDSIFEKEWRKELKIKS